MCLFAKQELPLIAKEPIKAFKVLIRDFENRLLSPYHEYDYTEYVINHCVITDVIPKAYYPAGTSDILYLDMKVVNKGLHLCISKDKATELAINLDGVMFECNIPAGSYYFTNDNETEICTNQFQFIKEIDIELEDLIKQLKK